MRTTQTDKPTESSCPIEGKKSRACSSAQIETFLPSILCRYWVLGKSSQIPHSCCQEIRNRSVSRETWLLIAILIPTAARNVTSPRLHCVKQHLDGWACPPKKKKETDELPSENECLFTVVDMLQHSPRFIHMQSDIDSVFKEKKLFFYRLLPRERDLDFL